MGNKKEVEVYYVRDGVWEDPNYKDEKKKILMKFDEVQNCTFQPSVRSKMPEKQKISQENPNLLYGAPETNIQKKISEYKVNYIS